jgi:hypothetical protein
MLFHMLCNRCWESKIKKKRNLKVLYSNKGQNYLLEQFKEPREEKEVRKQLIIPCTV